MKDVCTEVTFEFVRSALPFDKPRLLEIGCGDGRLAERLAGTGATVIAVDSNAECVRQAVERGIDARQVSWPDFPPVEVDAVIFTRSLHHISALEKAVAAAARMLSSVGVAIVEDFAFDEVNRATAGWFQSQLRRIAESHLQAAEAKCFARTILDASEPLAAWHHDHSAHERLHTAKEIDAALRIRCTHVVTTTAPYVFRYVSAWLNEAGDSEASNRIRAGVVGDFLEREKFAIESGEILPIGRRFVARQ